jgi:hypothetical protein
LKSLLTSKCAKYAKVPNYSGIGVQVQEIQQDRRHDPQPPPASQNPAGSDQAPAAASFLNPEP